MQNDLGGRFVEPVGIDTTKKQVGIPTMACGWSFLKMEGLKWEVLICLFNKVSFKLVYIVRITFQR